MAAVSIRLRTVRERLERARREFVLLPECFAATSELGLAIGEISQIVELLERRRHVREFAGVIDSHRGA